MAGGAVAYGATAPGGGMMGHRLERYTIPGMFALMRRTPASIFLMVATAQYACCASASWVRSRALRSRCSRRPNDASWSTVCRPISTAVHTPQVYRIKCDGTTRAVHLSVHLFLFVVR